MNNIDMLPTLLWNTIATLLLSTSLAIAQHHSHVKTAFIKVFGNCEQCKDRIEKSLIKGGVYTANWDIETNVLTLSYDSTKLSTLKIQKKMALLGHDTEAFQATDRAYNKLPMCCYYSRYKHPASQQKSDSIQVILQKPAKSLEQVLIKSKHPSSYISSSSALHTTYIGSKELKKAACCNLSESFETTSFVDMSYAEAITGVKQIQLLGLSGNYTLITIENTPSLRGLVGSYGLTFIPGPWMENIQITKGTGSVVNGYESIAGQIDIEEKKPDAAEKLFINTYANDLSRLESNINLTYSLNTKWSTGLLTHVDGVFMKMDENKDGFLDIPLGKQLNLINRWKYVDSAGLSAQFAGKVLTDSRQAGENDFNPSIDKLKTRKYGIGVEVQQYELSGKLGYLFPQQKYKSIGLIFSAINYKNESYYGLKSYAGMQNSIYTNLVYQSIIGTTAHQFRTGLSFVNDHYEETVVNRNFKWREIVPGTFFEHSYTPSNRFTALVGLRLDYHNEYRWMFTPRLHLKYNLTPETNLRFSAGSGFKTAYIFAENKGFFASSREYTINANSNYAYGLKSEKAWNYGLNLTHQFRINDQAGSLNIDMYRIVFANQVVVDADTNPKEVLFYDLNGKSFSNSIQFELNYEPIESLELRLAYRWLDVQTDYNHQVLEKPMIAKYRAFINLAYETMNHWKFDCTTQWFSKKRLPTNAIDGLNSYSKPYLQMMAQITKQFNKALDLYVGCENLSNYQQKNLIIAGDQPFGPNFDGSIVWGPATGRMFYLGLRYKL